MSQELVKLKITVDDEAAKKALKELDATIERLNNTTINLSRTPLQQQVDQITGVSRSFKSAEESANALLTAEAKLGLV